MSNLAASLLPDYATVFVGIGAPCAAAMLAKRNHAPNIELIFESGVIGASPDYLPLSTGSPAVSRGAYMIGSMLDVFAKLQRGEVDVGLLSGAQVDRFGNLNSTVIGQYEAPKVRLPGSGGAHDIAALSNEVIILMPHDPRRFVEAVSFVTSPGHRVKRDDVAHLGKGPSALVTDRAIFRFDNGELSLAAHYSDVTSEQAVDCIPWQVPHQDSVELIPLPSPKLADLAKQLLGELT